jgi:UDP-N-acetylmuramoyl-L-alanyl-D-glutamate--2,6-diaminopimelate ligase
VTLRELLAALPGARVTGPVDGAVRGLVLDSRKAGPGDVFFALPGVKADGARFAEAAVAAGAIAVVGAAGLRVAGATVVEVDEPRLALAQAACALHGHPTRALEVVAVTGTNGKTTTTFMIEAICRAAGIRCGLIGTTGVRIDGESRPSAFTTPEAPELQALLAEMAARGVEVVALEASSHALVQRRTWGMDVDVAVFTNLTQDHLDYHGTMEAYLDAKLMLFDGRNGGEAETFALVNGDDPARAAVERAAARGRLPSVTAFGAEEASDLRIEVREMLADGMRLRFAWPPETDVEFTLPMLGRFNAHNAAAAFGAATFLGAGTEECIRGLETFAGVPGRLERVDAGQPFTVVVDYAHTPDALERALAACREHARGRVLCVFGCGGDRDRGKRPLMGAIAARMADAAWVTNDNPRSEDPAAIAREIVAGAPAGGLVTVLDRRDAIGAAVAAARAGDIVLIAGKGHETTQTTGAEVLPFDDREVARAALGALR